MIVDLLILVLALLVASLVLAPLESLRWWATQGAEQIEAGGEAAELRELADTAAADPDAPSEPRKFLVYLSGIGAIGALRTMNRGPRYANDFWITDMPDAVAGALEEILLRS